MLQLGSFGSCIEISRNVTCSSPRSRPRLWWREDQLMNNRVSESHQFATQQSRQSAKLFLKSSELGHPHPLTRRRVCPPPFVPGGSAHSLAGEGVHGGVPMRTRGNTMRYSKYICTLWYAIIIKFTKPRVSNSLGCELHTVARGTHENLYLWFFNW